jgi:MOSC domain-containing protein YiiM
VLVRFQLGALGSLPGENHARQSAWIDTRARVGSGMPTSAAVDAEVPALTARVEHIYISPGHNFFYRDRGNPEYYNAASLREVNCVAGKGLEGDRFFDFKKNYKGQVTFFDLDVLDEMARMLGVHNKLPSAVRRNVFVRGVDLNSLVGKKFSLQGIVFEGTQECAPCHWMDYSYGPGAHAFLKNRGGLRAMILTSGTLQVDG